jgi:hypothetical protein
MRSSAVLAAPPAAAPPADPPGLPARAADPVAHAAVSDQPRPRQFFIQGITKEGRTFRPSDWAERLAGVMSSFRPGGVVGSVGPVLGYSPYCVPRQIGDVKCVLVSEALRDIEPMAWDFVMHFARDNDLQVVDADAKPAPGPSGI